MKKTGGVKQSATEETKITTASILEPVANTPADLRKIMERTIKQEQERLVHVPPE